MSSSINDINIFKMKNEIGKWEDYYILVCTTDYAVRNVFMYVKTRYSVPDENCLNISGIPLKGAKSGGGNCLSSLNLFSKLIIIGHGSPTSLAITDYFESACADDVALLLMEMGLRRVGLISFKSCNIGTGHFLDELLNQLTVVGVKVGWLLGYKDIDWFRFKSQKHCIGNLENTLNILTIDCFPKFPDCWRVKVVKGNIMTLPARPSSRFHY